MKQLLLIFAMLTTRPVEADSLTEQWTTATKLAVAQCLVAETSWGAEVEKAAVAHVLVKRWLTVNGRQEISLLRMVRAYCAMHHKKVKLGARRWLRQLRWSTKTPRACGELCKRNWPAVMNFVETFATGKIADPLPQARHFGNEEDHRKRVLRGKLGPVRLLPRAVVHQGSIVRLTNFFYAL